MGSLPSAAAARTAARSAAASIAAEADAEDPPCDPPCSHARGGNGAGVAAAAEPLGADESAEVEPGVAVRAAAWDRGTCL